MQFIHFLPLLMLLLFSFLSSQGISEDVPFSLDRTDAFRVQRKTPAGTVYFVRDSFQKQYMRDYRALSQVEALADAKYFKKVEEDCNNEKREQNNAIKEARKIRGTEQAVKLQQAHTMKLPNCEKLQELRNQAT